MDRSLIEQYADGGPLLVRSIAGLTDADWSAHPVPGTWSLREIVLHLMDSDLIASDRMKRIIALDNPTLLAYDEAAFARSLGYNESDAAMAVNVFAQNRALTAAVLRRLPDAAFARHGTHNERGPMTLAALVSMYIQHLNHHLDFFRQKRALLGKPL
jgi:uncharacterized damage-inducible protein DinB